MALRGVIFDLGGTIVEYEGPRAWEWPGLEAFRQTLIDFGYADTPSTEALLNVHIRLIEDLYRRLEQDPHASLTQDQVFQAMLAEGGIALTPAQRDAALARYYEVSHSHVRLLPGARETLQAVQARGLRLAALSNTQWPGRELDLTLDVLGVKPYLPVRVYSADVGVWKPWPAIFERALAALDLKPEETAYVGDVPRFDVKGAHGVGMRAVWLNRQGNAPVDGLVPDATIHTLPELLDVVDRWMRE